MKVIQLERKPSRLGSVAVVLAMMTGVLALGLAGNAAWGTGPLGAVVAGAMLLGFVWQQARARERWRRAALDVYAEREIARRRHAGVRAPPRALRARMVQSKRNLTKRRTHHATSV
jgi:hypothetical protein